MKTICLYFEIHQNIHLKRPFLMFSDIANYIKSQMRHVPIMRDEKRRLCAMKLDGEGENAGKGRIVRDKRGEMGRMRAA